MPRAPDARAEQARNLFLSGKKLIEIASSWTSQKAPSEVGKTDINEKVVTI